MQGKKKGMVACCTSFGVFQARKGNSRLKSETSFIGYARSTSIRKIENEDAIFPPDDEMLSGFWR
jgi:hypothetical protein